MQAKGRKRHILVDTLGLLLNVVVHPADIQDRDGEKCRILRIGDLRAIGKQQAQKEKPAEPRGQFTPCR